MLTPRANIQCKKTKNYHVLCHWHLEHWKQGYTVRAGFFFFFPALGLHCCAWTFSCCRGGGYSLVVMGGLLLLWSTCSNVHGLQQLQCVALVFAAPWLQSTGSLVVEYGLNCSEAHEIFLDLGLNQCLLLWQANFLPLSHQGSPNLKAFCHLNLKTLL